MSLPVWSWAPPASTCLCYAQGIIAQTGFGALAVLLLITTVRAYLLIRQRRIAQHREWMIYSNALIFAAVTLRLELPPLASLLGGRIGYATVEWLSWVPNLLVMMVYVRQTRGVVR